MKTYYITDSTIFNKAEDVVKALMSGETVLNDDAKLRFIIKTRYKKPVLMFQEFYGFKDEWNTITPRVWSDAGIIEAMDAVVKEYELPAGYNPTDELIKAYFNL